MLRADVDGDCHLDEVRDPDREGVITVEGGGSPWRTDLDDTLARLGFAGSENPDREARATLGDFDGDGYVDLTLFWSGPTLGDDPVDDMPIHEVHFGPLSRDLTGENVGPLRIRHGSFVSKVRADDQDGDGRAELRVIRYAGDGVYEHLVGRYHDDGITVARASDDSNLQDSDPGWGDFETRADE